MTHAREPLALMTIGEVSTLDALLRDASRLLSGLGQRDMAERCDAARRMLELEPLAKRIGEAAQQRGRDADIPYVHNAPCPRCDVCGDYNPGLSVREADGTMRKRCNVLGCAGYVS